MKAKQFSLFALVIGGLIAVLSPRLANAANRENSDAEILAIRSSTPAGFTDNLDEAREQSRKTGKPIFAVFSGSDWCYWCKVLDGGYLSKKEFVERAEKDLILVFIDRPQNPARLSEHAKKNNLKLLERYDIQGFPTVLFIDADGHATKAMRPTGSISPREYAEQLVVLAKKSAKK